MFYYQTFFLLQICFYKTVLSKYLKKIWGHRARLREKEHLVRYRAYFEGNLLSFVRAHAHVRALMTRKSCAVGMPNAIPRNNLKSKFGFTCSFEKAIRTLTSRSLEKFDNSFYFKIIGIVR